jgi:hypothetical protein
MKSCILVGSSATADDVSLLKELATSRFDKAENVIKTTQLNIMDIVDAIRTGGFKRVYMQSEIHLGRVTSEMIALAVCLDDLGIGIVGQNGKTITDSSLMASLEHDMFLQFQNITRNDDVR